MTEGSHGKGNTSALIDLTHVVIMPSVHRGIWKMAAASVNVQNALQIGKAGMEAYENKLPQAFCDAISSYVVTMGIPMKWINTGVVTAVDIEVVFNRTLGIIGIEEFDLHDLFSYELAPIATSLFLDDGSMMSASSK